MKSAMDCPGQTNHQRQETSDGRQAQRGGQAPTQTHPEEFTTGQLADALTNRGYFCTRDTVEHFVKTRKIEPVKRSGNYRIFDRVALDLLRQYLKNRKRKRNK